MAARFPASASMQRMANNPQQASMFQRSQFQQSPYGMTVSFWFIDYLNSLLGHLKLCQLNTHEGYFHITFVNHITFVRTYSLIDKNPVLI